MSVWRVWGSWEVTQGEAEGREEPSTRLSFHPATPSKRPCVEVSSGSETSASSSRDQRRWPAHGLREPELSRSHVTLRKEASKSGNVFSAVPSRRTDPATPDCPSRMPSTLPGQRGNLELSPAV